MSQTYVEVQDLILGDDFEPTRWRTTAKQAVNDGLAMVARNATVPELEDTYTFPVVAGTASYALPDDFVRLRSVYDTTRRVTLQEVDAEVFDNSSAAELGVPSMFMQFGGNIKFWPTPDYAATLTMRYLKRAVSLSDDDDVPGASIPEEYVYMLVAFGRSRLFAAQDDPEMSAFWRQEFDRELSLLRSDLGRRSMRRTRQVPGMWATSPPPRFRQP